MKGRPRIYIAVVNNKMYEIKVMKVKDLIEFVNMFEGNLIYFVRKRTNKLEFIIVKDKSKISINGKEFDVNFIKSIENEKVDKLKVIL